MPPPDPVNITSILTGARQRQVPIVNFNGLDVYFTTYIVHPVEKHSAKIMPFNGHLCRSVIHFFVFLEQIVLSEKGTILMCAQNDQNCVTALKF